MDERNSLSEMLTRRKYNDGSQSIKIGGRPVWWNGQRMLCAVLRMQRHEIQWLLSAGVVIHSFLIEIRANVEKSSSRGCIIN